MVVEKLGWKFLLVNLIECPNTIYVHVGVDNDLGIKWIILTNRTLILEWCLLKLHFV